MTALAETLRAQDCQISNFEGVEMLAAAGFTLKTLEEHGWEIAPVEVAGKVRTIDLMHGETVIAAGKTGLTIQKSITMETEKWEVEVHDLPGSYFNVTATWKTGDFWKHYLTVFFEDNGKWVDEQRRGFSRFDFAKFKTVLAQIGIDVQRNQGPQGGDNWVRTKLIRNLIVRETPSLADTPVEALNAA